MAIKDRIKKIEQYFKEMQVATVNGKQVIYVVVNFPSNWIVDDELAESKNVIVSEGSRRGEYYFCVDMEEGEGPIFDVIDKNIEKMKEAVERAQLLAEKTKELKEIFEDESVPIDSLRALKFTYEKQTRKYKRSQTTKKDVIINDQEEETDDNNIENIKQENE